MCGRLTQARPGSTLIPGGHRRVVREDSVWAGGEGQPRDIRTEPASGSVGSTWQGCLSARVAPTSPQWPCMMRGSHAQSVTVLLSGLVSHPSYSAGRDCGPDQPQSSEGQGRCPSVSGLSARAHQVPADALSPFALHLLLFLRLEAFLKPPVTHLHWSLGNKSRGEQIKSFGYREPGAWYG